MAKTTLVLSALLLAAVAAAAAAPRGQTIMPRGSVPSPPPTASTIPTEAAIRAGGVRRMPHVGIPDPNAGSSIRMGDFAGAAVDTHFEGIDVTTSTPPDPHFAVGKKGMVMVVNGEISLHRGPPTYQRIEFEELHKFFGYNVNDPVVYDPRAVYNHYSDRYLVIALRGASLDTGESSLVMALSKTDEPESLEEEEWILSAIDTDVEVPANPGALNLWADYPTLGYDEYNAYVGFNMFQIASSSGPIHAKLFAIPWDDIADANSNKKEWMRLQDFDSGSTLDYNFTPQPAIRYHTPGATTDHFTVSHSSSSGNQFTLYRTRNPNNFASMETRGGGDNTGADLEPEVINIATVVAGCGVSTFSSPSGLDGNQADSTIDLDVGDARLLDAFHRADLGLLYTVVTTRVNSDYTGVLVVGFNTTTENTTCHETHLIADASNGTHPEANWFFGYPSVAITDEGDIAVAFTGVRELDYGSVFTAYKVNGTWSGPLLVMEGQAPYERLASDVATATRWGDYSQMVLDPNDGTRVWGFVEYAGLDPDNEESMTPNQFWTTRAFSYQLCSTCTVGGCSECANTSPCFLGDCVCDSGRQGEGYDCPNLCPQLCFADEGRGTCNYLDRTCTCNSGWVGEACENADPVTLFIFMGVLFVVVVSMMMLFSACHPEYASFGEV